ncbi:hypothetical protein [Enemella sp. A6]|uniref:hypothetical protein n=1 Tax=Enemella sp. A6 TaxID=3440152 RepID=UPI003EB6BF6D
MSANPTFEQAFVTEVTTDRPAEQAKLLPPVSTAGSVGFGRLFAVEVRKLTNTVTGRVMLGVIALLTLAVATVTIVMFDGFGATTWLDNLSKVGFGVNLLLPILGILLATQEWTQRTALTTFALEPRRGRVLLAKLLVVVGVAITAFAVLVAVTIASFAIGASINNVPITWTPDWAILGGALAVLLLNTVMATGFGMLLMNTPAAIVLFMGLPTLMPLVSMISEDVAKLMMWIDPNRTWGPLMGGTMDADAAAKLAVSAAIWIVLPLTVGIIRQLRREVK